MHLVQELVLEDEVNVIVGQDHPAEGHTRGEQLEFI
jgi:hypothetical protein